MIKNDRTEEVKKELQRRVEKALNAVGIQASSAARRELNNSPKREDTGLLRNSITYAISGQAPAINSYSADRASRYSGKTPPSGHYDGTADNDPEDKKAVYIGTNVKYAIYVHEGTNRMAPNRFIKNACENNIEVYKSIIEQCIKD